MQSVEQLGKILLIIALFSPVVNGVFTFTLKEKKNKIIYIISSLFFSFVSVIVNIYLCYLAFNNVHTSFILGDIFSDVDIMFKLEPMGALFALLVSVLWFVTNIFSIDYFDGHKSLKDKIFFEFSSLVIFATMLIAYSANIITTVLAYELLTISTFPLITMTQSLNSYNSGKVYLGYVMGSSVAIFLPSILFTMHISGNIDFQYGGIFPKDTSTTVLSFLYLAFLFGISKTAIIPIHRWLPKAMVAPTPVSALLHAVAVVKSGVFVFAKITLYIFGSQVIKNIIGADIAVYIICISIVTASIITFKQTTLKGLLAYSTISQLGYMMLGFVLATPLSIIGAILHMIAHALAKSTLFFAVGSIKTSSKKVNINEVDGIAKKMPFTSILFAIASISMIGLPFTAGMVSKWFLIRSAWTNYHNTIIVLTMLFSTLMSASYFLPIVYNAFFMPFSKKNIHIKPESKSIVLAMFIAVLGIFLMFFYHSTLIDYIFTIFKYKI